MQTSFGKRLLRVTGITFILFGALKALLSIIAFIIGGRSELPPTETALIFNINVVLLFVLTSLEIIAGITGVKNRGKPSSATLCIALALAVIALQAGLLITNITIGGQALSIIGMVLSVCYLTGAILNRISASKQIPV